MTVKVLPSYAVYDPTGRVLLETYSCFSFYAEEALRWGEYEKQPFWVRWFSEPKPWSYYASLGYEVKRVKIVPIDEDDPFYYTLKV